MLLAANVGDNKPLPSNGHIELSFNRLLMPDRVTRQSFVLENAAGTIGFSPEITYDPVARVVTITPLSDASQKLMNTMLTPNESLRLTILSPASPTDPNGLRAIDGATLDPASPKELLFTVTGPPMDDAGNSATPPAAPSIDYCRDIDVIFGNNCEQGICHGGVPAAAGLVLSSPSDVMRSAIGRVAQGSNTGPRSVAEPPSHLFGEDMPIIDPGSNPDNSWMMYKVLLAIPSPAPIVDAGTGAGDATTGDSGATEAGPPEGGSSDASAGDGGATDAGGADGGGDAEVGPTTVAQAPPVDVSHAHQLGWQGLSNAERTILSNYILGREMPFPSTPPVSPALTLDEMERLSLWIAQGSPLPASCQ